MVWRADNIRQPGATAKVNLALSGLPAFNGADDAERLEGPDHGRACRSTTSSGRWTRSSTGTSPRSRWLEATIPSLVDPSLAPEGKHVMSIVFQAAPRHLRDGDWAASATASATSP